MSELSILGIIIIIMGIVLASLFQKLSQAQKELKRLKEGKDLTCLDESQRGER